MRRRSDNQLVLDLRHSGSALPLTLAPPELLQALADLLLEALASQNNVIAAGRESCDASQDHA
jgi:hypothetical protein